MSNKVTYRQQFTRCGKQRCRKCREGIGHGPYWYAYWSEKGRTRSKYVGIHRPDMLDQAQPFSEDEEREGLKLLASQERTGQTHQAQNPILRVFLLGQFRIESHICG